MLVSRSFDFDWFVWICVYLCGGAAWNDLCPMCGLCTSAYNYR